MKNVYFLGIGGIGMSALARFFRHEGSRVAGYDLTRTPLTEALEAEGVAIHYSDDPAMIPPEFRDPGATLVVYTPAVPADHAELKWLKDNGFTIEKRSEVLGRIARQKFTMAVAGTHGKTTTTTLVAWLNRAVTGGGSAFLGGISKNFGSNLVLDPQETTLSSKVRRFCADRSRGVEDSTDGTASATMQGGAKDACFSQQRLSVEADEFDRSFLRLNPDVAVITSVDPDHLDIYGTYEAVREAFTQFVRQVKGITILNSKVDIEIPRGAQILRYSLDDTSADFHARNIKSLPGGHYSYDIVTPDGAIEGCTLGITGRINVENSIAATALIWAADRDFDRAKLKAGLAEFQGVKRRFDFWVNTPQIAYMDDYAHHPEELNAALTSLRAMFPERRITAVFQPHLFSRTQDLHAEFAAALSRADEVILLPIYPAREKPIAGVNSELIGRDITAPWSVVAKESLVDEIRRRPIDVLVTFGAGNIENHCAEIAEVVRQKE